MEKINLSAALFAVTKAMDEMTKVHPVKNYYEFNNRKNSLASIITQFEVDCINYWKAQPEPAVVEEPAEPAVNEQADSQTVIAQASVGAQLTEAVSAISTAPVKMTKEQLLDDLVAYMAVKIFHIKDIMETGSVSDEVATSLMVQWGAEAAGTGKGTNVEVEETLNSYAGAMEKFSRELEDEQPAGAPKQHLQDAEESKEPSIPVGSDSRISDDGTTLIVESHFARTTRDGKPVIIDRKSGEIVEPKAKPANSAMADALVAAKAGSRQQHNQPKRDRHQRGER